jgi:hypothetical protein
MEAFGGTWPRWRQLTSTAAHRGMLCFGPDRGRKVTYTNPHRWLPGFRPADGDAAQRTLVTRYLYAYGPATPQHFAKWLGIPPRYAIELFDKLGGELECVELDGRPGWTSAGDTGTPPAAPRDPPAALLRRVRRRRSAPGTAVPWPGRHPRAHPGRPGRKLPGTAHRRRGRRGVAPAALRPETRHHRRTAARPGRAAPPAARRRGRPRGRGHGSDGHADGRHRDGRPARVSERTTCCGHGCVWRAAHINQLSAATGAGVCSKKPHGTADRASLKSTSPSLGQLRIGRAGRISRPA